MTAAAPDPLELFLSATRRRGDEAQFTQIIAAASGSDPAFAGAFARLIVALAPSGAAHRGDVPEHLRCRPEVPLYADDGASLGFVDLVFEGEGFALCVELKLHSGYGYEQLDRYRRGLGTLRAERTLLAAVTITSPPRADEAGVASDDRWLGSLRWSQLFDPLAALPHASRAVQAAWVATLHLMRRQGDFGPMDIDAGAVSAWAKGFSGERALRHLLREAAVPVADALTAAVDPAPDGAPAVELLARGRNGSQPVIPWKGRLHVAYAVPATAQEPRFRLQFMAHGDSVAFTAEARFEHPRERVDDAPAVVHATDALRREGFAHGVDGEGWYWSRRHDPLPWFEGNDALARLIDAARADIAHLSASGLWPALEVRGAATEATPVTDGDPSDEV